VPDLLSDRQKSHDEVEASPFKRIQSRRGNQNNQNSLYIDMSEVGTAQTRHIDTGALPTPLQLTQQFSFTPSLELQRTISPTIRSRGYAWQANEDGDVNKGYVAPSHRNPTALQAFYDTHFGSSSGFRSVASLADDIFHPIDSAKGMLSRLSLSSASDKRESKAAKEQHEQSNAAGEEIARALPPTTGKDTLQSWRLMPFSPAIFGMGSSTASGSAKSGSKTQQTGQSTKTDSRAYQPELIPTVHRDPHAGRYFKRLEGNVVILGGYRGSILRDAVTKQMIWVPLKVGVGLRRPTLELGLDAKAEDRSEDFVKPDEMLGAIGNMVDSGKRLIARCSTKRTKVHSFGYDWRLSLARSSERLEAFLQQLWQESAQEDKERRGAKVVAHSMGGLVALHALTRTNNPRIFDSLVFASTPFLGTANILGPFAFGDAALWNDEICSPRATFSFRSSFYLLPVNPSKRGSDDSRGGRCFEEEDGTPHDLDFLDVKTWREFGFSPCVKNQAHLLRSNDIGQEGSRRATVSSNEEKADNAPALPGVGMQMQTPDDNEPEHHHAEEAAQAGLTEALNLTESLTGDREEDTEETLQPANRQKDEKDLEKSDKMTDEEEQDLTWAYLERTLGEVSQFFRDLRTGFRQDRFEQGDYPPMAILTSGRTPTVRGALVWPRNSPELTKQEERARLNEDGAAHMYGDEDHWKRSARLSDYSRMLYAPGDGVILRESAATMPGDWGKLLVREALSVDEKGHNALTNNEGIVETSHRHVTLLSDVDGIGRCLEACRRARQHRSGANVKEAR
jgi:pimeloyl-ACP methyl ester carboxylesterase